MIYEKPFMTIKELEKMGLSAYSLKQCVYDPEAPIVRTSPRGKIRFDTTQLDDYLAKRKNNRYTKQKVEPWSQRKKKLRC